MAMTKAYYSVNGRILGEASGGTRLDYMTDALGSVTGTVDSSAQVVNTYRYKPYGELLAKTGSGSDPRFRWVGSSGYRQTGRNYADVYLRARSYSVSLGTFISRAWLAYRLGGEASYGYASANPIVLKDPNGNSPKYFGNCNTTVGGGLGGKPVKTCFEDVANALLKIKRDNPQLYQQIEKDCLLAIPGVPPSLKLDHLYRISLSHPQDGAQVCVFCRDQYGRYPVPQGCEDYVRRECENLPNPWDLAFACPPILPPGNPWHQTSQVCRDALVAKGCTCGIVVCDQNLTQDLNTPGCCLQLPIHEMLHCAADYSHPPGTSGSSNPDWLWKAAACICKKLFPNKDCSCAGILPPYQ